MEPLKPEEKEAILKKNPLADPADIEEYERLLSERFTVDPNRRRTRSAASATAAKADRLTELHKKLFGG